MRLRELRAPGEGGAIELHPNLTVINGLSAAARDLIIGAVQAIPAGEDPGMDGLVEAHGVLFDLTMDTLELFGLSSTVDVLVRAEDLPGAAAARAEPARHTRVPAGEPRELEEAQRAVEEAREAHGVLEEAHERALQQCAAAADARQRIMAALDLARRERDQARARLDAGDSGERRPGEPDRETELKELIRQLSASRDELAQAVQEHEERDPRPIQVLMEEYHKPPSANLVPSQQAQALADEFAALQGRLAEVEARLETEGRGTESALRRLEEARLELAEAERAVAKPEMRPDDIAELEAVHEEVLEAEQKASSRLGRRSAQKRLDEVRQQEQEILDRIGFPTWSAYVMGSTLLNIDPADEQRLERARAEMAQAEEEWAILTEQLENDPEYRELLDQLEAVYLVAFDILGGDDEGDLEQRLREVRVPEEEVPKEDIVDALAYQLELVGVEAVEDAAAEVIVGTAERWLEATEGHWENYHALKEEHVRVVNELAAAERELEMFGAAAEELVGSREERAEALRRAEAKVAEVLADLEQATELEGELAVQVEAREALMAAARASVMAAEGALRDAEERARRSQDTSTVASPEPKDTSLYDSLPYAADSGDDDEEEVRIGADELEFYFLARFAALRSVSQAGSVPIVIDDAMAGLPESDLVQVLDRLVEFSEMVQVLYLTDDETVTTWASGRGLERAAVVHAPSAFV